MQDFNEDPACPYYLDEKYIMKLSE